MLEDYHFQNCGLFPARLLKLCNETGLPPYGIYKELNIILDNPENGDTVTPFYSDIRIHTVNVGGMERHILYGINKKHHSVILIEASQFNLRHERQRLLYSWAALYELHRARKFLFKFFSGLVG